MRDLPGTEMGHRGPGGRAAAAAAAAGGGGGGGGGGGLGGWVCSEAGGWEICDDVGDLP
eukprot:CAMPEP_0114534906 /NCGR_PEP_ID=MMETSP0109-20121206/28109_1 /TAXON_ID=29199 /ORGANISM="Chlorarachnion reptans, Strain CCCM449" /LENGTH=58 /DNA_ID=CAMNT_0001718389 /DNA_START=1180 /DNA_END=1356 /DNA_ORIENTATION=-